MTLQWLKGGFSVCKLGSVPTVETGQFRFLSVTDGEISLVCESESVPDFVTAREDGWRGFRVVGPLDFALIGVLSELSAVLAEEKIGIFVISTYDTDYIFVKKENFARACDALTRAGHIFTEESLGE